MTTLVRAFSWLNQFTVSHLSPASHQDVQAWADVSITDYTFSGAKQSTLDKITDLDPLERPEVLLAAAVQEAQRGLLEAARESVRSALQHYPETSANRHRRAAALWMLGSLEYDALNNYTAYASWQTARLLFQTLAAEQVHRRNPPQARWYYERLHEMNIQMALTAEEAFTWLNVFPSDAAVSRQFRAAASAGGAGSPPRGDLDAHLRDAVGAPMPDLPVYIIVDKVNDYAQTHRYASARRFMEQLQFLAQRSSDYIQRPEIWVECGLAAHQMEMYEEAVELLRHSAAMFAPRSHQQAVVYWMTGAVLGLLPERRGDFILYWDLAIDIFREQEARADHRDRQARWEWYHRLLETLPAALERRVSSL